MNIITIEHLLGDEVISSYNILDDDEAPVYLDNLRKEIESHCNPYAALRVTEYVVTSVTTIRPLNPDLSIN